MLNKVNKIDFLNPDQNLCKSLHFKRKSIALLYVAICVPVYISAKRVVCLQMFWSVFDKTVLTLRVSKYRFILKKNYYQNMFLTTFFAKTFCIFFSTLFFHLKIGSKDYILVDVYVINNSHPNKVISSHKLQSQVYGTRNLVFDLNTTWSWPKGYLIESDHTFLICFLWIFVQIVSNIFGTFWSLYRPFVSVTSYIPPLSSNTLLSHFFFFSTHSSHLSDLGNTYKMSLFRTTQQFLTVVLLPQILSEMKCENISSNWKKE